MSDIKRISTIELKNELESRGYKVTYYRRPDGAIRISSINGIHYKLSEGNKAARAFTGKYLSRKQITQRREASPYAYSAKLPKLTKAERLYIRRYNRRVRKTGVGVKVKMKTARVEKRKMGFKGLREKLFNISIHAQGIAYSADVEAFHAKLEASGFYDAANAIVKSIQFQSTGHAAIMDSSLTKEMDYWYDLKNLNGADGKTEEELVEIINEDYEADTKEITSIYQEKILTPRKPKKSSKIKY